MTRGIKIAAGVGVAALLALGVAVFALGGRSEGQRSGIGELALVRTHQAPTAAAEAPGKEPRSHRERARHAPKAEEPKEPRIADPIERAEVRRETRDDLIGDLRDRLSDHAEAEGWEPALQREVEDTLVRTTTAISKRLADVDAGRAKWEDVRRDVRQQRLDQAEEIRALLGNDGFDALVEELGLRRFEGEEPVRGRLPAE